MVLNLESPAARLQEPLQTGAVVMLFGATAGAGTSTMGLGGVGVVVVVVFGVGVVVLGGGVGHGGMPGRPHRHAVLF